MKRPQSTHQKRHNYTLNNNCKKTLNRNLFKIKNNTLITKHLQPINKNRNMKKISIQTFSHLSF